MTLRFLYKIWSGFDGFTPSEIPARMRGGLLSLGWTQYIDDVSPGDEVWTYFHGKQTFTDGVYIKGKVSRVQRADQRVSMRPVEFSVDDPLTDNDTGAWVGRLVAARGRQVFAMPFPLARTAAGCTIDGDGSSCADRKCADCPVWTRYRLVRSEDFKPPDRLDGSGISLSPAYWTMPRRSYLASRTGDRVRELTAHFNAFKAGDTTKAYPLALGMSRQLANLERPGSDAELVPVPLSPDKAKAREVHRTKLLAEELGNLLGLPVVERVALSAPISKRRMPWSALTRNQYEQAYRKLLDVKTTRSPSRRILVVDDVCTRGATIAAVVWVLHSAFPDAEISAATAGLMVLKETVLAEDQIVT